MAEAHLHRLGARDAARGIAHGAFTAEAYVSSCLERIAARESSLGAWSCVAAEAALRQARECDAVTGVGALHGVPIGVKDLIDTHDMPTTHGSPIYDGVIPPADAAAVAMLRSQGALVLGKTVTPEFAALTPGKTVNPHNFSHTPGGSSSGSAAAVADFMVPAALGTQTVGSTIRPASYCGVVGFVASYQILPVVGVKAQAPGLDNLGILTRSVEDAALLADVVLGTPGAFQAPALVAPPRIGFCPSPHWPGAQPATRRVMDQAIDLLRRSGAVVEDADLPAHFADVLDAHWTILCFEFARALAYELHAYPDKVSARLTDLLAHGRDTSFADYRDACRLAQARRAEVAPHVARFDALLTPAASGEAPQGIETPSDLLFQRLWTVLHLPVVTLPGLRGPGGLPVGVQLVGSHWGDAHLLAVARWVENAIAGRHLGRA